MIIAAQAEARDVAAVVTVGPQRAGDGREVAAFLAERHELLPDQLLRMDDPTALELGALFSLRGRVGALETASRRENIERAIFYYSGPAARGADGRSYLLGADGAQAFPLDDVLAGMSVLAADEAVVVLETSLDAAALAPPEGVTVVLAAGRDQEARRDEAAGLGLFTMALLEGAAGAADANANGVVDGVEAADFAALALSLRGEADAQVPLVAGEPVALLQVAEPRWTFAAGSDAAPRIDRGWLDEAAALALAGGAAGEARRVTAARTDGAEAPAPQSLPEAPQPLPRSRRLFGLGPLGLSTLGVAGLGALALAGGGGGGATVAPSEVSPPASPPPPSAPPTAPPPPPAPPPSTSPPPPTPPPSGGRGHDDDDDDDGDGDYDEDGDDHDDDDNSGPGSSSGLPPTDPALDASATLDVGQLIASLSVGGAIQASAGLSGGRPSGLGFGFSDGGWTTSVTGARAGITRRDIIGDFAGRQATAAEEAIRSSFGGPVLGGRAEASLGAGVEITRYDIGADAAQERLTGSTRASYVGAFVGTELAGWRIAAASDLAALSLAFDGGGLGGGVRATGVRKRVEIQASRMLEIADAPLALDLGLRRLELDTGPYAREDEGSAASPSVHVTTATLGLALRRGAGRLEPYAELAAPVAGAGEAWRLVGVRANATGSGLALDARLGESDGPLTGRSVQAELRAGWRF